MRRMLRHKLPMPGMRRDQLAGDLASRAVEILNINMLFNKRLSVAVWAASILTSQTRWKLWRNVSCGAGAACTQCFANNVCWGWWEGNKVISIWKHAELAVMDSHYSRTSYWAARPFMAERKFDGPNKHPRISISEEKQFRFRCLCVKPSQFNWKYFIKDLIKS